MAWKARFSCRVKLNNGSTVSLMPGETLPADYVQDNMFRINFYWSEMPIPVPVIEQSGPVIEDSEVKAPDYKANRTQRVKQSARLIFK